VDSGRPIAWRSHQLFHHNVSRHRRPAKFEYVDLQMEVIGTVVPNDPGYEFVGISIRANLTVASPESQQQGVKLLQIAESRCVVARALAIHPTFEPVVTIRSLACGMNGTCAVPETASEHVAPK